jgi:hypothetical protein
MKLFFTGLCLVIAQWAQSQQQLVVADISAVQLRVMEKTIHLDSAKRTKIFIDSIYTPYRQFWNGYLGEGPAVAEWLNNSLPVLGQWKEKNKMINGVQLLDELNQVAENMQKLTGYKAYGHWYIVFGPAWTDLGGLGDFAMLIDLAHKSNSSNEQVMRMFPHELTHQIMTNVNKNKDSTALESIIGEGFAVWMNQYYWKQKYTLAENLGYSVEGLAICENNLEKLKAFLTANKFSTDNNIIDAFRNRGTRLNAQLPGAIGYYLGYKVIEAYVHKFGEQSWKDVFTQSPRYIYEQSGFTE